MRKTPFANEEFYHIYNRGVDKRNIFFDYYDITRFFQSMIEFNSVEPIGSIYENSFEKKKVKNFSSNSKLVRFICFCLNPNHYHFILEQVVEKGIEKFMHRLSTGYTKYFNGKYKRTGALFGSRYKSIHIDSNEYLLHLSAYINLNDRVHALGSSTSKLSKTSWEEYTKKQQTFCYTKSILDQFKNKKEYKEFAEESLRDMLDRKVIAKEMQALFDNLEVELPSKN